MLLRYSRDSIIGCKYFKICIKKGLPIKNYLLQLWTCKSQEPSRCTYTLWWILSWLFFIHSVFELLWEHYCSDLLSEINVLSDRETLLKFKAEKRQFPNFFRSLEQFIQQWKIRRIFGNRILEHTLALLWRHGNYFPETTETVLG